MNMVTLKHNNIEEAEVCVSVLMLTLRKLFKDDLISFTELAELAKDSTHKLWSPEVAMRLKQLSLIDCEFCEEKGFKNVQMHSTTQNVILSAIEGEGLQMRLVNPLVEASNEAI